jgi:phospholipid-binding lipoprotein MlaA
VPLSPGRRLLFAAGLSAALGFGCGPAEAQDIRQRLAQVVSEQRATPILADGVRGESARLHLRRAVEAALSATAMQFLIEQPGRANEVGQALVAAAPGNAAAVIGTLATSFPGLAPDLARGAGLPAPVPMEAFYASGAPLSQPRPSLADPRQNAERAAASAALIATIAADPAGLADAVRQAIAKRPADREAILQPVRDAFPGFAQRIDLAAAGTASAALAPPATAPTAARSARQAAVPARKGDPSDPLEDFNRVVFALNDGIDVALLRPLAWTYNKLVPDPAILAIRRFFNNLASPAILANDLLQGAMTDGGVTLARFLVNSTAGVGGLFEVAQSLGLPRHTADFGQTLHSYGLDGGPYLMLPLLGPANVRDGLGRVVDMFLDPLGYVLPFAATAGLGASKAISTREEFLQPLDDLKATALDYYSATRSLYTQRRAVSLNKGRPLAQDKELDALFESME